MRSLLTVRRVVPAMALAAATWASAEVVTFATTPNVAAGDDIAFTSNGGLGIVASGYESTRLDPLDILFSDSMPVTLGANGLGINGTGLIIGDPSDEIDGLGIDEFLLLTFDTAVTLNGVTLGKVDSTDYINIWALDSNMSLFPDVSLELTGSGFQDLDLSSANLFGTRFLFSVDGGLINSFSDYALAAVDVTPVPLPPAVLGGLALFAVAGAARKRWMA